MTQAKLHDQEQRLSRIDTYKLAAIEKSQHVLRPMEPFVEILEFVMLRAKPRRAVAVVKHTSGRTGVVFMRIWDKDNIDFSRVPFPPEFRIAWSTAKEPITLEATEYGVLVKCVSADSREVSFFFP